MKKDLCITQVYGVRVCRPLEGEARSASGVILNPT